MNMSVNTRVYYSKCVNTSFFNSLFSIAKCFTCWSNAAICLLINCTLLNISLSLLAAKSIDDVLKYSVDDPPILGVDAVTPSPVCISCHALHDCLCLGRDDTLISFKHAV